VLVHCKGGHGRGAAAAAAWLLSPHGGGSMTPAAAQRRLDSCRHVRKKLLQQEGLLRYYEEVRKVGRTYQYNRTANFGTQVPPIDYRWPRSTLVTTTYSYYS
jgi:protein-tyrosine phosphatase